VRLVADFSYLVGVVSVENRRGRGRVRESLQEEHFPAFVGPFFVLKVDRSSPFDVKSDQDLDILENIPTVCIVDRRAPDLVGLPLKGVF